MTWAVKMADARYDGYDEGYEKGISIGLEQVLELERSTGREEGAYQKALETAKKLIARGSQPEDIADVTGLSLLQIKELMAK